ncbi:hypothetical protein SBV1_2120003 [Verrucomicrobia bacterium]|nr:hypothetical protein SBV1_2120003 [Verrucomicrobiota bacterium]
MFPLDSLEHFEDGSLTDLLVLSYVMVADQHPTQSTIRETSKNRGMNIALLANGRRIAQVIRHPLYGGHYNFAASADGGRFSHELGQRSGCQDGGFPCAEILRCKIPAADLKEKIVHIGGGNMMDTIVGEILEKELTGQVLTFANDFRYCRMFNGQGLFLSAFSAKAKTDALTGYPGMTVAQGCQSIGIILLNIFLIPYAHAPNVQHSSDRSEHFIPVQARTA